MPSSPVSELERPDSPDIADDLYPSSSDDDSDVILILSSGSESDADAEEGDEEAKSSEPNVGRLSLPPSDWLTPEDFHQPHQDDDGMLINDDEPSSATATATASPTSQASASMVAESNKKRSAAPLSEVIQKNGGDIAFSSKSPKLITSSSPHATASPARMCSPSDSRSHDESQKENCSHSQPVKSAKSLRRRAKLKPTTKIPVYRIQYRDPVIEPVEDDCRQQHNTHIASANGTESPSLFRPSQALLNDPTPSPAPASPRLFSRTALAQPVFCPRRPFISLGTPPWPSLPLYRRVVVHKDDVVRTLTVTPYREIAHVPEQAYLPPTPQQQQQQPNLSKPLNGKHRRMLCVADLMRRLELLDELISANDEAMERSDKLDGLSHQFTLLHDQCEKEYEAIEAELHSREEYELGWEQNEAKQWANYDNDYQYLLDEFEETIAVSNANDDDSEANEEDDTNEQKTEGGDVAEPLTLPANTEFFRTFRSALTNMNEYYLVKEEEWVEQTVKLEQSHKLNPSLFGAPGMAQRRVAATSVPSLSVAASPPRSARSRLHSSSPLSSLAHASTEPPVQSLLSAVPVGPTIPLPPVLPSLPCTLPSHSAHSAVVPLTRSAASASVTSLSPSAVQYANSFPIDLTDSDEMEIQSILPAPAVVPRTVLLTAPAASKSKYLPPPASLFAPQQNQKRRITPVNVTMNTSNHSSSSNAVNFVSLEARAKSESEVLDLTDD